MNQQLVEVGREIIQQAPQLYIDLDVESDGKAGYGSLLSIGAVSPWGDTFYRELKPTSNVWVQSQRDFCEAHGLQRERLIREGTPPPEAIRDLTDWQADLSKEHSKLGSVIVAFNASFDYPLVDLEYQKSKTPNPFGVAGYCIKSLAAILGTSYDWRDTTKSKLPRDVVPEGGFTHHALEDAVYQQQIHFAMVGKIALIKEVQDE